MTNYLSNVQLFLLDMEGTFNLGEKLIPGSLDFIAALGRQKRDYVFVTNNSSRSRRQYVEKLTRLGLPTPPEKVFTSGEAACLTSPPTRTTTARLRAVSCQTSAP